VVSINADETDIVENQLVIALDPTDATLAFEEKRRSLVKHLEWSSGFSKDGELRLNAKRKGHPLEKCSIMSTVELLSILVEYPSKTFNIQKQSLGAHLRSGRCRTCTCCCLCTNKTPPLQATLGERRRSY
jgi:hypothetical protein